MLTAEQARAMMPSYRIEALTKEVCQGIEIQAANDQKECRISGLLSNDEKYEWISEYVYHGKLGVMSQLVDRLKELGYTCSKLYTESQFVDMDVIVSWA